MKVFVVAVFSFMLGERERVRLAVPLSVGYFPEDGRVSTCIQQPRLVIIRSEILFSNLVIHSWP